MFRTVRAHAIANMTEFGEVRFMHFTLAGCGWHDYGLIAEYKAYVTRLLGHSPPLVRVVVRYGQSFNFRSRPPLALMNAKLAV